MKAIVLCAATLLASATSGAFAVTAYKGPSCSRWIQDREADRQATLLQQSTDQLSAPQLFETLAAHNRELGDFMWLSGYLSGVAVNSGKDFLRDTDSDTLAFWIDNHCRQTPLDSLADAAEKLSEELTRRMTGR